MGENAAPLIDLRGITKQFVKPLDLAEKIVNLLGGHNRAEVVHAVDDVNLSIAEGEVLGLVGETVITAVGGVPAPTDAEQRGLQHRLKQDLLGPGGLHIPEDVTKWE